MCWLILMNPITDTDRGQGRSVISVPVIFARKHFTIMSQFQYFHAKIHWNHNVNVRVCKICFITNGLFLQTPFWRMTIAMCTESDTRWQPGELTGPAAGRVRLTRIWVRRCTSPARLPALTLTLIPARRGDIKHTDMSWDSNGLTPLKSLQPAIKYLSRCFNLHQMKILFTLWHKSA